MKDTDLAWLAGLWDGEGSIAMFERKEANRTIRYCPTLVVVNNDLDIINEVVRLTSNLGVNMHMFTRRHQNPKHRTTYQLSTRNQEYIRLLLEAILPFLVGKRSQAEMMLRYIARRAEYRKAGGPAGSTVDLDGTLRATGDALMAGITAQNATRLRVFND